MAGKTTRPASGKKNGKTVKKSASGKTPSARERREEKARAAYENSNARLSEFSDGYNDFYVDEMEEQRLQALESKREEKRKKKAKKSKPKKPRSPKSRKAARIIGYASIVAVIIIVGVVLSLTVLFKTQAYEVTGTTKYTDAELIETCGIAEGENIFLAPKTAAEKRLENAYPYVEKADVSFRIPDTITISVTEAVEGYLVKVSDEEYLLVSTKGRILSSLSDITGYDLPLFIGPALVSGAAGDYVAFEDSTVMDIIDEITTVFADNGYQGITEIDATSTANISFTYDNRIRVKLGLPEDLSYKIRTAMTIITEKIDVGTSSAVEGELDVSRCNVTKKSYFNEQPLVSASPTEAQTTPDDGTDDTDAGDWYYDEDSGEWYWYDGAEDVGGSDEDDWYTADGGESGDGDGDDGDSSDRVLSQDDWYVD